MYADVFLERLGIQGQEAGGAQKQNLCHGSLTYNLKISLQAHEFLPLQANHGLIITFPTICDLKHQTLPVSFFFKSVIFQSKSTKT